MPRYLIGIDIGTSGCKAMIFDCNLNIASYAYNSYPLIVPKPGWVELDPDNIWSLLCKTIKSAISKIEKLNNNDSFSISFSVIGNSLVLCKDNGDILYPCILSQDLRSKNILENLKKDFEEDQLFNITGGFLHTKSQLPRIIWAKRNLTNLNTHSLFLDFQSWLFIKLKLGAITDYSLASGSMLFDIYKKTWSEELLEYAGLNVNSLPCCLQSATYVGKLKTDVIKELGLPNHSDVNVYVGAFDQICNAIGSGTVMDGDFVCSSGTLEVITIIIPKSISAQVLKEMKAFVVPSAIKEQFVTVITIWNSGSALDWFCKNFAKREIAQAKRGKNHILDFLLEREKGNHSILFLPHLSGSSTLYLNPESRGAFLGLTYAADIYAVANAIIEGITFEIKENLDKYEYFDFQLKNTLKVVGGGAKSQKWSQMRADILEKEIVTLNISEVGALGAAIIAGYGNGIFEDIKKTAIKTCSIKNIYKPSEKKAFYKKKYAVYKKVYPSLKKVNQEISNLEKFL